MPSADLDFGGRVAVVTGAAQGIGHSISVELARRGATVWAGDVLARELEETVAACTAVGGSAHARLTDVTNESEVAALVEAASEAQGAVDILVNVAGGVLGQVAKPLEEVTRAEWQAICEVNLTGAFLCSRAVAPGMKAKRYGRIVSISSGAGRSTSLTGIQAYASAKAGQIGLTRQLAVELGPWGITSNSIAPGFVPSNPSSRRQWDSYSEERQRTFIETTALRRLGEPEDIANAVLFFASDLARWCTGQILSVDGGRAIF